MVKLNIYESFWHKCFSEIIICGETKRPNVRLFTYLQLRLLIFQIFFFCCYMYTDYTTAFNFQDTAHLRARFSLIYNDSLLLIPI